MLDPFSPCWIRIYTLADFTKTEPISHAGRQDANELSCWTTHRGRSQDFVCTFAYMNLDEAFLAFANSTIASSVWLKESVILDALRLELPLVHAHVGNLRVGVGRPW